MANWTAPTDTPPGTSVHVIVFSGSSPTYAIEAQGTATIDASGNASITGSGTPGDKAFALVHNFDDDTGTAAIDGCAAIATLT
jgi:hypothetical protein